MEQVSAKPPSLRIGYPTDSASPKVSDHGRRMRAGRLVSLVGGQE